MAPILVKIALIFSLTFFGDNTFFWVTDSLCLSSSSSSTLHFLPIILFLSTTLLTMMTNISLHM
jgi:hypothetical protein